MEAQIDLNTITDPKELKSLAYDQIAEKEEHQRKINQCDQNIALINQRLAQVNAEVQPANSANSKAGSVSDEDLGIEDSTDETDEVE